MHTGLDHSVGNNLDKFERLVSEAMMASGVVVSAAAQHIFRPDPNFCGTQLESVSLLVSIEVHKQLFVTMSFKIGNGLHEVQKVDRRRHVATTRRS